MGPFAPDEICSWKKSLHEAYHTLDERSDLLDRTPAELGVPAWDVVGGRNGTRCAYWELTGDRAEVLCELDSGDRAIDTA